MSDETKCPDNDSLPWGEPANPLLARITQLEQQLSVVAAALKPFAAYWDQLVAAERHPGESVVPLPPGPEHYRAAAEALRKIGATP